MDDIPTEEYQNNPNYGSSYIPGNIPVNPSRSYGEQLDFIKELLKKDELKEHISSDLEIYFDSIVKNIAVANFSEAEIKLMILRFDDLKTAFLMQFPPGAYTHEMETQFTALRNVLCSELSRAKDGFERKLMATSIQQSYMQSDLRGYPQLGSSSNSGGFFGKIRRMFNR
ncbi:MAG: hypothetical protein QG646_2622 [Euryarchaeota archaeon]|nr:hypothetical protein [Euryarchaeota archaeon]